MPVAVLLGALLGAGVLTPSPVAGAEVPNSCPGDPIAADQVITGSFGTDLRGSYVMVPFGVPNGTTAVRVKYCYDQPDVQASTKHTLDLGLYGPRPSTGALWGAAEFRGWGGSSHPDVSVSAAGFSSREQYLDDPKGHVPGRTTRGFVPGPVEPGEWAAEFGVASVAGPDEGDADGAVAWRLEIELDDARIPVSDRYRPARHSARPVRSKPGWYAGDLHVHGEHSALGDATMREVFDDAFRALDEGGGGLDFITLTDYVTSAAWDEIGRYQAQHPDSLVVRGSEVITYRGHTNNQASATYVDHRTGPVYELGESGEVTLLRPARAASEIFDDVHAAGGWTQINHPRIFPSSGPGSASPCRGCYWDYTDGETDFAQLDAIEVATGPSAFGSGANTVANPFTVDAIAWWEQILATGARVAAVGSSDSHTAGRTPDALSAPVGEPATVVYAEELSERGIRDAVQAGRTYVKLFGHDGPDLRLTAAPPGASGKPAIIGDTVQAPSVTFRARVSGADADAAPSTGPYTLIVKKDGTEISSFTLDRPRLDTTFESSGPGRYHLELRRGSVVVAVASPIYLEP